MRRLNYVFILIGILLLQQSPGQYNPARDIPDLFRAVQLSAVFPDSKTFADALPEYPVRLIREDYHAHYRDPDFNLTAFVDGHFSIPRQKASVYSTTFPPIGEHIERLWTELTRHDSVSKGSLIALPYPYVVPGGRFNEMYYWDSYFTMLGLKQSGEYTLMRDMLRNFAWLIDEYGFIPNGTRTYYLDRSQPPFFSLMIDLVAQKDGDTVYQHYLPQLQKEYNFWMRGADSLNVTGTAYRNVVKLDESTILNRYWDADTTPRPEAYKEDVALAEISGQEPARLYRNIRAACESGWDFSSRWLNDGMDLSTIHTTDLIPVDLNCLLYHLEKTLAKAYQLDGRDKESRKYIGQAALRKKAIRKYCRDSISGFYVDYDFKKRKQSTAFSLAGMFPLYFELADSIQAAQSVVFLQNHFLAKGGLTTTLKLTGQQWDAPNGWAPLQWISYRGLKNYGFRSLADSVKKTWLHTVEREYRQSGKIMEKYNVLDSDMPGGGGEYPSQDGFGWTNGVYLILKSEEQ